MGRMIVRDESPRAFPGPDSTGYVDQGMTLRDWFAGMALQGLLGLVNPRVSYEHGTKTVARDAYMFADAMLAAREAQ